MHSVQSDKEFNVKVAQPAPPLSSRCSANQSEANNLGLHPGPIPMYVRCWLGHSVSLSFTDTLMSLPDSWAITRPPRMVMQLSRHILGYISPVSSLSTWKHDVTPGRRHWWWWRMAGGLWIVALAVKALCSDRILSIKFRHEMMHRTGR